MSKNSVVRCLLVAALFVALLSPAAPLLAADGEAQAQGDETSGLVEGILDWLIDLVEPAEGNPDGGETGPRVDPAG